MKHPRYAACLTLLSLAACSSLSDQDKIRLTTFKQNSKQFYDEEQFTRAEDQCRKGLRIEPEDVSLNQVLAYSLLRQRDAQNPTKMHEAEQVFRACLDLDENDLRSELGLAEVLFQLGNFYEDQVPLLASDERFTADQRLSKVTIAQERSQSYFSECETILAKTTKSPEGRDNTWAHNTLGRLYAIQGRYEESGEVLRKLIGILGNSINLRTNAIDPTDLSDENRVLFEAEIGRLQRQHDEALHLLANVAAKRNDWEEVVSVYARLESFTTLGPADYYNRAIAYDELGSRDAAIGNYDTFKSVAASRGAAFSDNVHKAMNRISELRAGMPTRLEERRVTASR